MEGEPEHWSTPVPTRGTPIRLLVNTGARANTGAEDLRRRAAGCTALAQLLMEAGESVEIHTGTYCTSEADKPFGHTVVVTEAGAPVSIDTCAFWLGHPAAHRQITFRLRDAHVPRATEAWGHGGGYGFSQNFPESMRNGFDLVVDYTNSSQWHSDESTIAWITSQFASLTNPVPA